MMEKSHISLCGELLLIQVKVSKVFESKFLLPQKFNPKYFNFWGVTTQV